MNPRLSLSLCPSLSHASTNTLVSTTAKRNPRPLQPLPSRRSTLSRNPQRGPQTPKRPQNRRNRPHRNSDPDRPSLSAPLRHRLRFHLLRHQLLQSHLILLWLYREHCDFPRHLCNGLQHHCDGLLCQWRASPHAEVHVRANLSYAVEFGESHVAGELFCFACGIEECYDWDCRVRFYSHVDGFGN